MSRSRQTRRSTNEYESSFTPRSQARKGRRGSANCRSVKGKRRTSYLIYTVLILGGIALVGVTIYKAQGLQFPKSQKIEQKAPLVVNEKPEMGPIIEEGDEEDAEYGQRFTVSNISKLTVVVRAVRGESTLFLGKSGEEKMILREGDQKVVEGDQIWFRLGNPSNVDILVNNKLVTTRAQDQEKSYYMTRKQS